jgi:hypothetical protein
MIEEVTGGRGKPAYRNLYFCSYLLLLVIKLRTRKLYGHIACMREMMNAYKNLTNLKVRVHLRDISVDERIQLKLILHK